MTRTTIETMPAPAAQSLMPPRVRPVRRTGRRRSDVLAGYLFIAPAIIGLLLFVGYPMVTSLYHSFTQWNGLTPAKWIGFDNYVEMFTADPKFWPSVGVTLLWVVISVPVTIAAGLGLAVLVDRSLKGVKLFRTIFYLPVVLPAVAVLTLWKYIYDPTYGLANEVLRALHLPTSMWLGDAHVALASVLIVGVWGVGGTMIIFLAGLQAVPVELTEAAKVDGAGPIRRFLQITLPMIGPILLLQLVLQLNGAFQTFTQIAILTKGGPGTSTNLLMYKIYTDGFANFIASPNLGYATAEVWVLFLIVMIVTLGMLRLTRGRFSAGSEA
ncbi:multiple sugar transport system permease protein [Curtobacterium sp. PhB130]|uniref:carbohydrate ABC transporter permease n=1 Tax=unclassified Curtobacterium TaxID=257496 RepID=UPI000F96F1A4|nr:MULTISPECIES: sugar ABC transporter permease [unclassified Curtobacterium]ROP63720.1 multiple sugar transport system permease protein [Curtobacterium sp. ZW137]ROS77953.1 multiple sugar transport system permease protein [Curtobacterium sp. PhB130]